MATKTHPLFSNFSSGEISPKMDGRIDLAQYFNGVQELTNWTCVQQGGVKSRGGFHFVQEAKNSGVSRLIPFRFSEEQNYILLFGEQYIWFFMNKGFVVSTLKFPATIGAYQTIPEKRFRLNPNNFLLNPRVSYQPSPSFGFGHTRMIGETVQKFIPYEIVPQFEVADDLWSIRYDQDDENLYMVHPLYPPMVVTKGVGNNSFTIEEIDFIDGPYEDAITSPAITPSATTGAITLTAASDLFLPGHVGALWRLNHTAAWGYVKITGYTSATVVNATVLSTVGAGATTSHREGAWSDVNGWPRQICFHEGGMIFASNYEHPETIWRSKTNKYNDFTPGILDTDAYNFTPAELNIIRWVLSSRELAMGAINVESSAVGPSDGPITATDPPNIKTRTTHGSSDLVAPIKVGKAILFLQRGNRKIREFVYSFADDAYGAPDITIASEHLFNADIIDLVYQQEPDSLLWAIRNDTEGSLLSCSYDRYIDQSKGGMVAWSKHFTDGRFESIACIPYQEHDQLWSVVNRTILGVTKRYVEYYDPDISVDSGLTWDGGLATILGGLEHLAGKTVQIVGDGAVYPTQVVPASGELVVSPGVYKAYVGIGFTPKLVSNRPEVPMPGGGTSQGLKKRWNKIIVRMLNTTGITINGQVYAWRVPEDLMGSPPSPKSMDVDIMNIGWDTEGRITIAQPLPLPAHLVALTGTLVVSDD